MEEAAHNIKQVVTCDKLDSDLTALFEGRLVLKSSWVENAKKKLSALNFNVLLEIFDWLQQSLYIVHNTIVVAGDNFLDIQVSFQKLISETARLCNKSSILLGEFENTCKEAVDSIQIGYHFLQDGQDNFALATFQQLSKNAVKMEEECYKLSKSFNSLSSDAEAVLEKVFTLKSIQKVTKEKMEEDLKKLDILKSREKEKMSEAILAEKKAVEQQKLFEAEESALSPGTMIVDWINSIQRVSCTFWDFSMNFYGYDRGEKDTAIKEKRRKDAEAMFSEAHQAKLDAIDAQADLEAKAAKFENGIVKVDLAVRELHNITGWLKELSGLMLQTALLWELLEGHCSNILGHCNEKAQVVSMINKSSTTDRCQLLQSDGFRMVLVQHVTCWITFRQVCLESKRELQLTEKKLFGNMKYNPTVEEARENLHKS